VTLSALSGILTEADKHQQLMKERELEQAGAQKYSSTRRRALTG